jgi:hypothetical protein
MGGYICLFRGRVHNSFHSRRDPPSLHIWHHSCSTMSPSPSGSSSKHWLFFPALKHLALSDHPELPLDGSVEQVLLSDTLVANSSPSPAPRFPVSHPGPALPPLPVPAPIRRQHLSELRAFEGAGTADPTHFRIGVAMTNHHELDPSVSRQLRQPCTVKRLIFGFAEADDSRQLYHVRETRDATFLLLTHSLTVVKTALNPHISTRLPARSTYSYSAAHDIEVLTRFSCSTGLGAIIQG